MPARMWRHGIYSFLEVLHRGLPASREHMLTFIYIAYSMMALLYETVPAFDDTWIECLGDIARYRMNIEDDGMGVKEVWRSVSRHWYLKASDRDITAGQPYHHLAVLARHNAMQQLYYYTKSLTVAKPFNSTWESILTLFDPIMNGTQTTEDDNTFVKTHAMLFTRKPLDELHSARDAFIGCLDRNIAQTRSWMQPGAYIAVINNNSLLGYGSEMNPVVISEHGYVATNDTTPATSPLSATFQEALILNKKTDDVVFARLKDPTILRYVYVRVFFMLSVSHHPQTMSRLQDAFGWQLLTCVLNEILKTTTDHSRFQSEEFPRVKEHRPLPEDWHMRGLLWSDLYPTDWFSVKIDEDEREFEIPSMTEFRREFILWLGFRLVLRCKWLSYGAENGFGVDAEYANPGLADLIDAALPARTDETTDWMTGSAQEEDEALFDDQTLFGDSDEKTLDGDDELPEAKKLESLPDAKKSE